MARITAVKSFVVQAPVGIGPCLCPQLLS